MEVLCLWKYWCLWKYYAYRTCHIEEQQTHTKSATHKRAWHGRETEEQSKVLNALENTYLTSLLVLATLIFNAHGKMAFIKSVDTSVLTLLTYRDLCVTSPETNGIGPNGQVSSLFAADEQEGACPEYLLSIIALFCVCVCVYVETVLSTNCHVPLSHMYQTSWYVLVTETVVMLRV